MFSHDIYQMRSSEMVLSYLHHTDPLNTHCPQHSGRILVSYAPFPIDWQVHKYRPGKRN
jgi:hypothetical protein